MASWDDPSDYTVKQLPLTPAEPQSWYSRIWLSLRRANLKLWLWEWLSLSLSAGCIGAIFIILARYDGKPMPTWGYGITLNGLISVLAVFAKSALILPIAEAISQLKWYWFAGRRRKMLDFQVLDAASRGPWGCAVLLTKPHLWNTAAFGALLTIAAIGLEPSLQMMPTFYTAMNATGPAYVPRATFYTDAHMTPNNHSYNLGSAMQGAIFNGIFDAEARGGVQVKPSCSSGNCTWDPFTTLGVCTACTNLTDSLLTRYDIDTHENSTKYLLDTPLNIGKIQPDSYPTTTMQLWSATDNKTIAFPHMIHRRLLDLSILIMPPTTNFTQQYREMQAFECVLYFCLQRIKAEYVNGVFSETVEDRWPPVNTTVADSEITDVIEAAIEGTAGPIYTHSNKSTNITLRQNGSADVYAVDYQTNLLLQITLDETISGSYGDEVSANELVSTAIPSAIYSFLTGWYQPKEAGTPAITDPLVMMENLAASMTKYLRSAGDSKYAAAGTAWSTETFVRTRWLWGVLPLGATLLSIMFTIAIMVLSLRQDIPTWKSSALAPLFHGPDDELFRSVRSRGEDDLEIFATDLSISMRKSCVSGNWKFEKS